MNCKPKHRPNKPNSTKTPDSARQINQTTSNSSGEQVGAGGSRRQSQQQQQLQLQHHQRSVNASGLRRLVVLIQCDRSVWQLMPTVWQRARVYCSVRTDLLRLLGSHLISMCAREHSRLRVETGLRSVSSRQGSRNTRDTREHTDLGTAIPERLSDSRLVETTRYRVQVISSSMTWCKRKMFTLCVFCNDEWEEQL